jgi:ADP-heptose:LPS heptosyltransferase
VDRDWPLARVAALFSLAQAAVGNDSGPTHLAAAVGCPTVAVFGPTDPAVWGPVGPSVRVVADRSGETPWANVTVDRVEAVLRTLVSRPEERARRDAEGAAAGPGWR